MNTHNQELDSIESDDLFDEMFNASPLQRWQEIICNASPTLVGLELEALLEKIAIYEALLEQHSIDVESASFAFKESEEARAMIEAAKHNLAIESMAKILSNHE